MKHVSSGFLDFWGGASPYYDSLTIRPPTVLRQQKGHSLFLLMLSSSTSHSFSLLDAVSVNKPIAFSYWVTEFRYPQNSDFFHSYILSHIQSSNYERALRFGIEMRKDFLLGESNHVGF
jgi:hypothetical protein